MPLSKYRNERIEIVNKGLRNRVFFYVGTFFIVAAVLAVVALLVLFLYGQIGRFFYV